MANSATSIHKEAHQAYTKGRYMDAIRLQTDHLNALNQARKCTVDARKLLSLYCYSAGDLPSGIALLQSIEKDRPQDGEIPENIGVMLKKAGNNLQAVAYLKKALQLKPDSFNICDGLAHAYYGLGEEAEIQKYGRRSLEIKDAAAAKSKILWPIPDKAPPPFDYDQKGRNVVSFSLWGENPRYLRGALRNAMVARDLYPSWSFRFYCDQSVPKAVREELQKWGAQIRMRPKPQNFYEGLLWRFEVLTDPGVDRFLIRDADSVVNVKERVAVDEWISSDKWFHAMRDFPSHTEVLLAGMWGGATGVLPSLSELQKRFSTNMAATLTYDQQLLRDCAWPTVRQSVLIHDSVFTGCLGSRDFPPFGRMPSNRHVGQNEAVLKDAPKVSIPN